MWTQKEIEIIKSNHGKITLQQIHKLLPNHNYYALRSYCQRTLKLFRDPSIIRLPTKNTYNMNYWDKPTLMNSFLAGRIAGDGCLFVNKNNSTVFTYKCVQADEEIIDLFIKELNYIGKKNYFEAKEFKNPNTDKIYMGQPLVSISIKGGFENNAQNLFKWFNIPSENKTFRMGPTNLQDENLNLAFIIGLIDSDGNIQYREDKEGKYPTIDFGLNSGCLALIEWFKEILDKKFPPLNDSRLCTIRKQNNCYRTYISGARAGIIIDYLRKFPLPKLSRKWDQSKILALIDNKYKNEYNEYFYNEIKINTNLENNLVQNFLTNKNILFTYNENLISIPDKKIHIKLNKIQSSNEPNNYKLKQFELYNQKHERLINIFENELILKPKIIISRLKSFLGLLKYKIYARKCEIREINSQLKDKFLNKYHIQGKDYGTSVNLGLFYKNKLVSIMSFLKKKTCYELSRFSSIANFNIIGGASKLLTYFERQYKPNLIVSFADKRWSNGNLYNTLNFKLSHSIPPKYWYFKDNDINLYHKFGFRHKRLSKKLDNYNSELTESENMKNNGWHRIFDCGLYCFKKEYGVITNP